MQVLEAIDKRYSYRGTFLEKRISRTDLEQILRAGLHAPSGCNRQTTQFIALDDPALLCAFATIIGLPKAATAPAGICVLSCPEPAIDGKSYAIQDYSAAIQNMLLTITEYGYATCWVEGQVHVDGVAQRLGALLGLPENVTMEVYLPLGIPAEPQGNAVLRKPFSSRAWFNAYGMDGLK